MVYFSDRYWGLLTASNMMKVAPLCALFLFITRTGSVRSDTVFLQRSEGGAVVLPCAVEPRGPPPFGVYLKRRWLQPGEVLFKHTDHEHTVDNSGDEGRIQVSGDASRHALNVTISQLRAADTDRYVCVFMVGRSSAEDEQRPGSSEFFLLVKADAPAMADLGSIEACSGGSAVLPCLPPHGEALPVEGVSLKRQRGQAPVEELYHSKHRHGSSSPPPPPSSSSSSPSRFPADRVKLTSAPGPGGITFELTLLELQPADSGLYSCQLLLRGGPDTGPRLGTRAFFVSVQGDQCGCSTYSTLLYALSAAVVLLVLLLALLFVGLYKGKARHSGKSHPQAPIYEEMTGLQPCGRKPHPRHLEEPASSEYTNSVVKKSCPGNHYEDPSVALGPRSDAPK
ncbi:cd7 antigen-like [Spinachia spinachia]